MGPLTPSSSLAWTLGADGAVTGRAGPVVGKWTGKSPATGRKWSRYLFGLSPVSTLGFTHGTLSPAFLAETGNNALSSVLPSSGALKRDDTGTRLENNTGPLGTDPLRPEVEGWAKNGAGAECLAFKLEDSSRRRAESGDGIPTASLPAVLTPGPSLGEGKVNLDRGFTLIAPTEVSEHKSLADLETSDSC